MSGLLSMIGMQTELDYLIGDFPACFVDTPLAIPKGNIPSDKQKCQPKEQHEFTIKGIKIQNSSISFTIGKVYVCDIEFDPFLPYGEKRWYL